LTLQLSLLTANTYAFVVKSANGSTVLGNWSGTLAGTPGSAMQMFTGFNVDTGAFQNDYFNTLQIFSPAGPVVTIASPVNNASFYAGSTVVLSASAADLGGFSITNVAYYTNGTFIGNAANAPYNFNWLAGPVGSYALTAVAGDALGKSATSAVVNVTLTAPPSPQMSASGLAGTPQSIIWSSAPGLSYMVLATTNLSQPFKPLSGAIPATGLSTSYLDNSNSPPAAQKFYRIEIAP